MDTTKINVKRVLNAAVQLCDTYECFGNSFRTEAFRESSFKDMVFSYKNIVFGLKPMFSEKQCAIIILAFNEVVDVTGIRKYYLIPESIDRVRKTLREIIKEEYGK